MREIARREKIGYKVIEAGDPGSSAVFLLDKKYVVKIFPPEHTGDADVEAAVLNALLEDPLIPVPHLYAKGVECILGWPYLLMSCVSGVALRELLPHLDLKELERVAGDLGRIVYSMHRLEDGLEPTLAPFDRGWSDTVAAMEVDRTQALQTLQDLATHSPDNAWVHELADAMEAEWDFLLSGPGMLVNRDLTEDHVYLIESAGRWQLSGLIDFSDAAVRPCELDWHDLRFWAFARHVSPMRTFLGSYYDRPVVEQDLRRSFLSACVCRTRIVDYGPTYRPINYRKSNCFTISRKSFGQGQSAEMTRPKIKYLKTTGIRRCPGLYDILLLSVVLF